MRTTNKIFAVCAVALVITLTYRFTFITPDILNGTVLGEEDNLDDSLESLEKELDASLAELDSELEIETEAETTEKDVIIAPTQENKVTTRKSSKMEKLLFVLPVEIETEVISDKGVVVEEKKTLLGKILDLLSY